MKRTFIGIEISAEARRRAVDYTSQLQRSFPRMRVGWERPEKLHITLKFVGQTEDDLLSPIAEVIRAVAEHHDPFQIALEGTGVFPSPRNARVLWLGLRSGPALAAAANELDLSLASLGFKPETRKFSPHLTIARLREPGESRELVSAHLAGEFLEVPFAADAITFFESRLLPTGSVYSPLGRFPFRRR